MIRIRMYWSFWKIVIICCQDILFYLGWLPAILLMVVEVVFMISTAGVTIQNQQCDGRDIVLQAIWIGLLLRVSGGILYSFGVPIPILLPFTGSVVVIAIRFV